MNGRKSPKLWTATVLAVILTLAVPWTAFAAVWTDQQDYAPGSVVTISGDNSDGAGYVAGETVHVDVYGPNGYYSACEAAAEENGAWWCQVTLWADESAVGEYTYYATGQIASEMGTFTDAAAHNVNFATSGLPNGVSISVTYSATNNGGNPVNDTKTFSSPGPSQDVGTKAETSFTYSGFSTSVTVGAQTCTLGAPSLASPFTTGAAGGRTTVTAPYTCTSSDTTPPLISYEITGSKSCTDPTDWYTSDVFVDWTVSDPESTVVIDSGCVDTTIDYDTIGVTLNCVAHSAGGSSSASVTIKRDATPPVITASLDKSPAGTRWFNIATGAPTVSFTCSDATSGLVGACPDAYTFPEGENQSYSKTIYDNACNSASDGVNEIDVDLTAPSITWNGGPADGGSYCFGFVPAAPTCTATDSLSGPDGCTVTGYSTAVGSHTMTATAYDVAGNSKAETWSYEVKAWEMYGFYQPVDMNGVWNTVKGGSTVPLKFEVFAGSLEFTDPSVIVQPLQASKVSCATGAAEDAIEELAATGSTVLRYDFTDGQFIYNWKTPKSPGICYKVTVSSKSGSSLTAYFKLK